MQLQQPPVVRSDASMQRLDQLAAFLAGIALGEIGKFLRITLSLDQCREDGAATAAEHIRQHTAEFKIRILQGLLDAQGMLRDLSHQLLAGTREVAQLLNGRGRHETGADQAMRQQVRNPARIVHVRLSTRDIFDVLGIGQHQLNMPLQQMPHRLPVHARGFHRDVTHCMRTQPFLQFDQRTGGRSKAARLIGSRFTHAAYPSHHRIFVNIQSCTARVQYLHRISSSGSWWHREEPSLSKSTKRAPRSEDLWQQFGVLAGFRVQLLNGLVAPRRNRPRSQCQFVGPGHHHRRTHSPASSFGVGRRPMENY